MVKSFLTSTDSYSLCHRAFRPNNDWQVSYLYNRNAPMIVYFGYILHDILNTKITTEEIDELEYNIKYGETGIWFDRTQFDLIVKDFDGHLPLEFSVIPDGTYVPRGTPFCQVTNIVKGFADIVTWIEAAIMKGYWGSCAATKAWEIYRYLLDNKLSPSHIHNFARRSYPSEDAATIADNAYAIFNISTDGLGSINFNSEIKTIPALSHNVIQHFTTEMDAVKHLIKRIGIKNTKDIKYDKVAIPIDTYDAENFIDNIMDNVEKFAKENGITLIYRVDSGDVINYARKILKKGLPVIISEGMTLEKIKAIDTIFKNEGFDINTITYGMGGGWWHPEFNREHLGWAMKTAYANYKDCMKISNDPIKESLPGIVDIIENEDGFLEVVPNKDPVKSKYTIFNTKPSIHSIKSNLLNSKSWWDQKDIIISKEMKNKIIAHKNNILTMHNSVD